MSYRLTPSEVHNLLHGATTMKAFLLHDTPSYQLISYGNGAAYDLRSKKDDKSVFFQGEDATSLSEQVEALERAFPNMIYDDLLRLVWNDYQTVAERIEPDGSAAA